MSPSKANKNVFLNCPFDSSYRPILHALIFTVHYSGLVPRCALEVDDGAENRLDKIFRIIAQCRYGIHDISRTELDPAHALPRFNMPLELGIFLGARRFGGASQSRKTCLILGRELYQHQKFLSDLAGQDVHAHHDDPRFAIAELRGWLRTVSGITGLAGGEEIWKRYTAFSQVLPEICRGMKIRSDELTFVDFSAAVVRWLRPSAG